MKIIALRCENRNACVENIQEAEPVEHEMFASQISLSTWDSLNLWDFNIKVISILAEEDIFYIAMSGLQSIVLLVRHSLHDRDPTHQTRLRLRNWEPINRE